MSKQIKIHPEAGDFSPVVVISDFIIPGEKRLFGDLASSGLGVGGLGEVMAALVVKSLDGDWSKVPGLTDQADAFHKARGEKAKVPFVPPWPDLMSQANPAMALGVRLRTIRCLEGPIINDIYEVGGSLFGFDETEEGN